MNLVFGGEVERCSEDVTDSVAGRAASDADSEFTVGVEMVVGALCAGFDVVFSLGKPWFSGGLSFGLVFESEAGCAAEDGGVEGRSFGGEGGEFFIQRGEAFGVCLL